MSFHKSLPAKLNRSEIEEQIAELVPVMPSNLVQVLAKVSARTAPAAFDEAKHNIDLLRGLWCYILQFRTFVLFRPARSALLQLIPVTRL